MSKNSVVDLNRMPAAIRDSLEVRGPLDPGPAQCLTHRECLVLEGDRLSYMFLQHQEQEAGGPKA